MATIRFNKKFENSLVQSSPNLSSVQKNSVYVDIHMDLEIGKIIGSADGYALTSDIVVDLDYAAINNSIKNFFSTRPGDKILSPEYGCDLTEYLFQPVNKYIAGMIGDRILTLEQYEPRIRIDSVNVLPIPDDNTYKIWMEYTVLKIEKKNSVVFQIVGGQFVF